MCAIKRFIVMLLCLLPCAPAVPAQQSQDQQPEAQANKTISQDVMIIIQQDKVRFTSQKAVSEMQLKIFDQTGELVYDSGPLTEPELNWPLQNANGEAVKSGMYAYQLSIKEAGAADPRVRRGHFIVDRAKERDGQTDRLWITSQNDSGVGTELTVARNENTTVAGTATSSERTVGERPEHSKRNSNGHEVETEAQSQAEKNKAANLEAAAAGTAGKIAKFTSATEVGDSVITELNGNVSIGASNPTSSRLTLEGQDALTVRGYEPFVTFLDSNHGNARGAIQQVNGGLNLFTDSYLRGANPFGYLRLDNSGNVGIGIATPKAKLELASGSGDIFRLTGYEPFITFYDTNHGYARGAIQQVDGGLNLFTDSYLRGANPLGYLRLDNSGNVGIGTATPQAKLDVAGRTRTGSLEITGGADFAENFDVNVAPESSEAVTPKVEAGMVVSLDPASPGKLALSTQAYDRLVAGIISGAGGVKPGMILGQEGTLANGKHPVALSGRVYCWVDASHGAIEVGDLLTTSTTAGHAMKVTDLAKAQGAIIGKAMTGLKEGKGMVLVLVTLQ